MFGSLDISASALTAQRVRLESIVSNVANANSLGKFDQELKRNIPYHRQIVDFEPTDLGDGRIGVKVSAVRHDMREISRPDPFNTQFRDANGMVYYPDIDMGTEMVDGMEARQAYEANITAIETTKAMLNATLRILG